MIQGKAGNLNEHGRIPVLTNFHVDSFFVAFDQKPFRHEIMSGEVW